MNKKTSKLDDIVRNARQNIDERAKGYREQALKLFPKVCGKCGREFDNKNLQELEVHHKNSDHNDNPPDGSNWELLCTYCHEHEHTKLMNSDGRVARGAPSLDAKYNPFAELSNMLKK